MIEWSDNIGGMAREAVRLLRRLADEGVFQPTEEERWLIDSLDHYIEHNVEPDGTIVIVIQSKREPPIDLDARRSKRKDK